MKPLALTTNIIARARGHSLHSKRVRHDDCCSEQTATALLVASLASSSLFKLIKRSLIGSHKCLYDWRLQKFWCCRRARWSENTDKQCWHRKHFRSANASAGLKSSMCCWKSWSSSNQNWQISHCLEVSRPDEAKRARAWAFASSRNQSGWISTSFPCFARVCCSRSALVRNLRSSSQRTHLWTDSVSKPESWNFFKLKVLWWGCSIKTGWRPYLMFSFDMITKTHKQQEPPTAMRT